MFTTHEEAVRENLAAIPDLQALIDRVGPKRVVTDSGCWEFDGGHSIRGYPQLSLRWYGDVKRGVYAKLHRLSLALSQGLDYFGDWTTLHTCPGGDNKGCWNPDHLRPGTNADNLRDAMQRRQRKGRVLVADHHDLVVKMRSEGARLIDIADAIGCQAPAVSKYLKKKGGESVVFGDY